MRRFLPLIAFAVATASAQQPFTLQQVLSAPYSTNLTAAPVGSLFAWVEHAEGRNNLWIGGAKQPARQLTHYIEDDAQDIASLTWSPDGLTIAYVYGAETGASGRPANPAHLQHPTPIEIILQPVDGGDPIHLSEGRAPLFSHDGKSLFFLRSGQIFIANLSCIPAKKCHPEQNEGPASPAFAQLLFDRGTASGLTLSPDGKLLAYISHRRTHSFLAIFDLETKTLTFPSPSTGDDSAPIFSRDGKQLAWLRFPFTDAPEFAGNRTSPKPWSIQILDLSTHTTRTLFQPEPNKPGSAEPRMSTGEPRLWWASKGRLLFCSEASGWVQLYAINTTGSSAKPLLLTRDRSEVEDVSIGPDGHTVLYASNDVGAVSYAGPSEAANSFYLDRFADSQRRHIGRLDLDSLPNPHVTAIFDTNITDGDDIETHPVFAADGTTIVALASSAVMPMHPVLISLDPSAITTYKEVQSPGAGPIWITKQTRLTSLHPEALPSTYPTTALVIPEPVKIEPKDKNASVDGQLFLPKSAAPANAKHPAILFFHGGPKRQMLLGYPAMDYYSNAYAMNQYLASRGYIVLSVNYRGGIGYGLDFRQCQHCGADGAAEYNDVLAAAAYLRSRPDVDAAHIGIWGGSYGGYLTALALARNSDIFAAGVDFHGVHEWAREDNATTDWLRGPLAEQEKIAALAHASSPMADVAKWKSPVLLIHGDDDPEVAYTQTPMLADALRARNVHVEELIFPDELHGFLLHKDWLAAYEAAANFFDRTLKPSK